MGQRHQTLLQQLLLLHPPRQRQRLLRAGLPPGRAGQRSAAQGGPASTWQGGRSFYRAAPSPAAVTKQPRPLRRSSRGRCRRRPRPGRVRGRPRQGEARPQQGQGAGRRLAKFAGSRRGGAGRGGGAHLRGGAAAAHDG